MIYVAVIIFFLSVFIFSYGILIILNNDKILVKDRVEQIKNIHTINNDNNGNKSLYKRALMPLYNAFCQLFLKAAPGHRIAMLNKKLEKAGLLKNNTIENWLFTRNMSMIIFSALLGILMYMLEQNLWKAIILSLLMILHISVVYKFYLAKKINIRKKMIVRDLPYTLDLITVSVEAGLSFDGAIARVINNMNGDICDEFAKTLKEIRMGIERKTALKNMISRCDVKELSMMLTSIIQADELGVGLGKVLRIESANLRERRKQNAREKAMKAPIKMLFPLIFFIFPAVFIIILGPAMIKIFSVF